MAAPFLILSCSPRRHGNSDFMAQTFAKGVQSAGGEAEIAHLRDLVLRPCVACQLCATRPDHSCPLANDKSDYTERLFQKIKAAPHLFIAAPIFFYALPAHFKGFIDRSQRLWAEKAAIMAAQAAQAMRPPQNPSPKDGSALPPSDLTPGTQSPLKAGRNNKKPATIGLVAGNKKGRKLFDGSLLCLRYFLDVFDSEITNTCLMQGYDAPQDLAQDKEAVKTILGAGAAALKNCTPDKIYYTSSFASGIGSSFGSGGMGM